MATATRNAATAPPASDGSPWVLLRTVDGVYRFFASLKLAVFSLGTLATVLAYATFFESWYGTSAVQEWIYQTRGFALLLAFLGMNILCAALIRYPWKRRQTGFVITHAGLLILLGGSFWSLKHSDEGQVGAIEGEEKKELVRVDYPTIRVWPIDPRTNEPTEEEFRFPFRPGNFAWGLGTPRPRSVVGSIFHTLTLGTFDTGDDSEILSSPNDPFTFRVKAHLPASVWVMSHVADPKGFPMAKIRPRFKAPNMKEPMDAFDSDQDRWFVPGREGDIQAFKKFFRLSKSKGPAEFTFLYVDRPELVEDFLHPPDDAGADGVATFRYRGRDGSPRVHRWNLAGQKDKGTTLPESDLHVTYSGNADIPAGGMGLERLLGEPAITVANFKVKKGDGPEVLHHGWVGLPMLPNVIPNQESPDPKPLLEVHYFIPPELDPRTNKRFGLVEVMGDAEGTLHYRVFGRGKEGLGTLRSAGKAVKGKEIIAFGGNPNLPMRISFEVEDYLVAGREEPVCEPIVLPKGQQGNGLAASLVEMTLKGGEGAPQKREFWIRRSPTLDQVPQRVSFAGGDYDVVYDVDRKPLGFGLKLDDFKVEFDPGTDQASSFVSKVRLDDPSRGIREKPYTISMNEPLSHRGYTFYQASYRRQEDPKTGRETGQFQSIFQVGIDPGRPIKYLGCLLIVLGAFVQFYMRAGIFTDGGKRERARAAALAKKNGQGAVAGAGPVDGTGSIDVSEFDPIL